MKSRETPPPPPPLFPLPLNPKLSGEDGTDCISLVKMAGERDTLGWGTTATKGSACLLSTAREGLSLWKSPRVRPWVGGKVGFTHHDTIAETVERKSGNVAQWPPGLPVTAFPLLRIRRAHSLRRTTCGAHDLHIHRARPSHPHILTPQTVTHGTRRQPCTQVKIMQATRVILKTQGACVSSAGDAKM